MTFWDTFWALNTTFFLAWIFKKYIEPILDKGHEKIIQVRVIQMGKLIIDIERAANKGYVMTWYKSSPGTFAKLAGTKADIEKLNFNDENEMSEWIKNHC